MILVLELTDVSGSVLTNIDRIIEQALDLGKLSGPGAEQLTLLVGLEWGKRIASAGSN